ncbi:MAG: DUF1801 domain-containing protein [Paracoccaceae bacterium]
MQKSKDERVQAFLDGMRDMDGQKHQILQDARAIVFAAAPDTQERFIYGGIMFNHNSEDFGGVFASKKHVSFEFGQGFLLQDPEGLLEGGGKFRRHLKLRSVKDVTGKATAGFVKQAVVLKA